MAHLLENPAQVSVEKDNTAQKKSNSSALETAIADRTDAMQIQTSQSNKDIKGGSQEAHSVDNNGSITPLEHKSSSGNLVEPSSESDAAVHETL